MAITKPKLALEDKGWWYDIRDHQGAVLSWLVLNVLDFTLTVAAVPYGVFELNWVVRDLSPLAFLLYKSSLTLAAVFWLAIWRWLRYLKWLNWLFLAIVLSNVYEIVRFLV